MPVFLEEITFNHNPNSATSDAFNIRKNETEFVRVPEWRRGETTTPEQSTAAYAIKEIGQNVITIKARFTCDDPTLRSVEVQAVNLREGVPSRGDDEVAATVPPPRPRQSEVLGWIPPQPVTFAKNGKSDFQSLKLRDAKISEAGVSVSVIRWKWQFRRGLKDKWKTFRKTCHQIYTVLKVPKKPWCQNPHVPDNRQLPWTDVLDYACHWARHAKDPDQAATKLTQSVRDLEKVFYIIYDFSSFYSEPNFDCSAFLQLIKGGIGKGNRLNCSDCATVVSTFANIVGCELWQSKMKGTAKSFPTNPIRLFGYTCWREVDFGTHEVAWKGKCTEAQALFDAVLELDNDAQPSKPPQKPALPTNIRFGGLHDRQYLFRLLSPSYYPETVGPRPDTRQHRKIRPNPGQGSKPLTAELLKIVKSHYEYDKWAKAAASKTVLMTRQFIDLSLAGKKKVLNRNILVGPHLVKTSSHPPTIQLLLGWTSEQLIRLDIDFCSSPAKARHFLIQRLGQFDRLNLQRRTDLGFGEITFVEPEAGATLFVRANLIALVRNGGQASLDPTNFARSLDLLFCELLAGRKMSRILPTQRVTE